MITCMRFQNHITRNLTLKNVLLATQFSCSNFGYLNNLPNDGPELPIKQKYQLIIGSQHHLAENTVSLIPGM